MKKIIAILFITCLTQATVAQPPARRAQQQREQAQKKSINALTTRAQISFPTEQNMSEDVVWRRDIYRQMELTEDANAGLYYPIEPLGSQMNLFCYMFKLVLTGRIPAYEYRLDGNELFNDSSKIKPLAFLDNYHIYYEKTNRGIRLDYSDIPSKEVTAYYIKECSYYDQNTATFHTKVLALCPILRREDDFGDETTQYPLFWVKFDDLAPYLERQTIMTSNLNNAATMSMNDYFTQNLYHGKIYKTTNMLGRTLAQYCTTDSAINKEQSRIESEIVAFEKNIWGDKTHKDSLDSTSKTSGKHIKNIKRSRRVKAGSDTITKRTRQTSDSSSASAARVTVRRERH